MACPDGVATVGGGVLAQASRQFCSDLARSSI